MTFAEKVQFVRRTLYLSQQALAKEIGVSFPTINRWENGHCMPNLILEAKFTDYCKQKGIIFENPTSEEK